MRPHKGHPTFLQDPCSNQNKNTVFQLTDEPAMVKIGNFKCPQDNLHKTELMFSIEIFL